MDTVEEIHTDHGLTIRLRSDDDGWVWRAETSALAGRGMPDFAIGAEPFEDDPHADMEFEAEGMAHVLDQIVTAWQNQPIRAHHPIEVEAYDGWNILVDPMSDIPTSDDRGFAGILLRWKLAPPPPPKPIDVTDEWAVKLRLGMIALEARTPDSITMQRLEREDVEFGHDQRFGPLTPWVVANARAMLALEDLDILVARIEQAAAGMNPSVNLYALSAVAGWSLRDEACGRVRRTAYQVARRIAARNDWKEIVKQRAEEIGRSRTWTRTYLGDLLAEFIGNTLIACALQDVMNDFLTMSATGAWCSLLSPHEDFPGEKWRCNDATAAILRRFFAEFDEDRLVDAIVAIDDPGNIEESRQCLTVIGSTLVSNSSPPPLAEIVGPGLRELLPYRGARSLMDQLARLIAGLAQPPASIEPADVARLRHKLTGAIGVHW